jgi:thiosulfate/3-mercaptopyruvate sulfurtransferase
VPTSFEYYGDDLLSRFDRLNNWKYTSPHNIQKKTTQNRECNNCHGNEELFLTEEKVKAEFRKANEKVIVARKLIPEKPEQAEPEEAKKKQRSYF